MKIFKASLFINLIAFSPESHAGVFIDDPSWITLRGGKVWIQVPHERYLDTPEESKKEIMATSFKDGYPLPNLDFLKADKDLRDVKAKLPQDKELNFAHAQLLLNHNRKLEGISEYSKVFYSWRNSQTEEQHDQRVDNYLNLLASVNEYFQKHLRKVVLLIQNPTQYLTERKINYKTQPQYDQILKNKLLNSCRKLFDQISNTFLTSHDCYNATLMIIESALNVSNIKNLNYVKNLLAQNLYNAIAPQNEIPPI